MIYPYKTGSNSAAALAAALGTKQIKHEGSKFKGNPNRVVINWGSTNLPKEIKECIVINKEENVKIASNKLSFFKKVEGSVNIPEFFTDKNLVKKYIEDGNIIVGRKTLNGHSGDGIVLLHKDNYGQFNLDKFRLFVVYIPKIHEYRVNVVGGEIVDLKRKALNKHIPKEKADWKIRTHKTGFVFVREGVENELSPQVKEQALLAISECGLDFGAVDIIYNKFRDKAYVLEVNTAPGLEGQTIEEHKKALIKLLEGREVPKKENKFIFKAIKDYDLALEKAININKIKMDNPYKVLEQDDLWELED